VKDRQEKTKLVMTIKAVRALVGMPQGDFAEMLGVSKQTLARIETGRSEVSVVLMTRLINKVNELGISVDFMFSDKVTLTVSPEGIAHYDKLLHDSDDSEKD
jgi:DNA-binding XRE family transcriptional regulator